MAYGTLKVDTITYNDGGSDVSKTVASLAAAAPTNNPTFTGTLTCADLTVTGTTTTVNTSTLQVEDKNIEIGKVSSPSDTTADGGGWTLKGASDKTFNWVNATDAWTSSEHIHLGDDKKLLVGTGSDFSIEHASGNNKNYIQSVNNETKISPKTGEDGIVVKPDGAVELFHDNAKKIETTSAGVTVTGTVSDSKGELRNIPQLSKSAQHTLVTADAGKHVFSSTGGWILNASTDLAIGDAITLINNSGSDQTLTVTGATCYNTADATTGDRILKGRGMATLICVAADTYYISGSGLS